MPVSIYFTWRDCVLQLVNIYIEVAELFPNWYMILVKLGETMETVLFRGMLKVMMSDSNFCGG